MEQLSGSRRFSAFLDSELAKLRERLLAEQQRQVAELEATVEAMARQAPSPRGSNRGVLMGKAQGSLAVPRPCIAAWAAPADSTLVMQLPEASAAGAAAAAAPAASASFKPPGTVSALGALDERLTPLNDGAQGPPKAPAKESGLGSAIRMGMACLALPHGSAAIAAAMRTHSATVALSAEQSDARGSLQLIAPESDEPGASPAAARNHVLFSDDDNERKEQPVTFSFRPGEMIRAATASTRASAPVAPDAAPEIIISHTDEGADTPKWRVDGRKSRDFRASSRLGIDVSDVASSSHASQPSVAGGHYEVLARWSMDVLTNPSRRFSSQRQSGFFNTESLDEEDWDGAMKEAACCAQRFVMHPSSLVHLIWDLVGLTAICYDCCMVPMEAFDPPQTDFTSGMTWAIRLFWTLNVGKSFMVGYMRRDGTVEMRLAKVARRYCVTWLLLDVFVVAFDWAELAGENSTNRINRVGGALRALRMVRTVRLFRLLKAPDIAGKISEFIPFNEQLGLIATIAKIMFFFLWIAHLAACAWYGLSSWIGNTCSDCQTWIQAEGANSWTLGQKYVLCYHWALACLSGDTSVIPPVNIIERLGAMWMLYLAFIVCASYVGSITTSMTRLQLIASEQSSKFSALRRFLADHNISRPLAVRVQRNAQHAMKEQKRKAPESSIELLAIISQPVLVEVHFEIHSKVLFQHPFMQCYNDINPAGMRRVCHAAISMLSLSQKDVLFSDLEVPERPKMYFIVSGKLLYQRTGKSPIYLEQGGWLVEPVLWTKWVHCGTLRASAESRFMVIDAAKFQDIVSAFPTDHASEYAAQFVDWLNNQGYDLSDIGASVDEITGMVSRAFDEDGSDSDEDLEATITQRSSRDSNRGSLRTSHAAMEALRGFFMPSAAGHSGGASHGSGEKNHGGEKRNSRLGPLRDPSCLSSEVRSSWQEMPHHLDRSSTASATLSTRSATLPPRECEKPRHRRLSVESAPTHRRRILSEKERSRKALKRRPESVKSAGKEAVPNGWRNLFRSSSGLRSAFSAQWAKNSRSTLEERHLEVLPSADAASEAP